MIITSWNTTLSSASSDHVVFPNDSKVQGPNKEWVAKWWQWWIGIPNNTHPGQKYPDAERCSAMQDGPVWFLPSIFPGVGEVKYQCNIPHGKDVMVDLTSTECESGGVEGNLNDQELRECAFNINTPLSNIEVSVDGTKVDISGLGDPIQTDFFNVTYPKDPVTFWGPVQPGTYRAIAEGYFLFLHDLPPGKHIIETNVADILTGKLTSEPLAEGLYEINIQ